MVMMNDRWEEEYDMVHNTGNKYSGLVIVCDRCNTRLWIKRKMDGYKPTIWVDGHDCKNIFIKQQVKKAKEPRYCYSHDTLWDGDPE
jgi:hypothetical protein